MAGRQYRHKQVDGKLEGLTTRTCVPRVAVALLCFGLRPVLADVDWARADRPAGCGAAGRSACEPLTAWAPLVQRQDAEVVNRYLDTCRQHQVAPSSDVLAQLQLGSDRLTIWSGGLFGELQLRALVTALEDANGSALASLRHLDLSGCNLGPSGALLLSQIFAHPRCRIESLDISYQSIGPAGTATLVRALWNYKHLRQLSMHSCNLGDEGGNLILGLLQNNSLPLAESIHLQNNFISFEMCSKLMHITQARGVELTLSGNSVLDEVMNAVTHGIGLFIYVALSVAVSRKTYGQPRYVKLSIGLYCATLLVMYLSSTLFHALFATGRATVYIFGVMDYSAIFLLIAGSYTPFLGILFHGECWAMSMLIGMWIAAIVGVATAAFYTGPGAHVIRLSIYLIMGWAAAACIPRLARGIGHAGLAYFVGGGVLYTAGVPFFIKGKHTFNFPDHAIWHVFVILGSLSHFWCVYYYVIPKAKGTSLPSSENASEDGSADYEKLESGASGGR